jgi:hypothetical protein
MGTKLLWIKYNKESVETYHLDALVSFIKIKYLYWEFRYNYTKNEF